MSEILDRIREKYPSYDNLTDDDLTFKIGEKFPVYLDKDKDFKADFDRIKSSPAGTLPKFKPRAGTDLPASSDEEISQAASELDPVKTFARTAGVLGKSIVAGSADLGNVFFRPVAEQLYPEQAEPGAMPLENIRALKEGQPLPGEQLHNLGVPLEITGRAAQGLLETTPKMAAVTALQAGGVPAPIGAGLIFGATEQGFSLPQAGIAATLPFVGKYSGAMVEALAGKLGVSNETALALFNKLGGATGAAALLKGVDEYEIAKLPPDQRDRARIDSWANIAGQSALGMMGETDSQRRQRIIKERTQNAISKRSLAPVQTQKLREGLFKSAEELATAKAKSLGSPLRIVDRFEGEAEGVESAKTVARATGDGIELHRGEFQKALQQVPENRWGDYIQSLIGEEHIHRNVKDADASAYWNTLTKPEQAIEIRQYAGEGIWTRNRLNQYLERELTDAQLGHEAIRRRIQKLIGQTPTEVAASALKERWTIQGIDALGSAIRKSRELLGTSASEQGAELIGRAERNLQAARGAVSSQGQSPSTTPSADDLLKMTPEQVVTWKKAVKYGPEISKSIAETLSRDQVQQFKAESEKLRTQATTLLKSLKTPEDPVFKQAQDISLKSQTLREITEDWDAENNPASIRRRKRDESTPLLPLGAGGGERPTAEEMGASTRVASRDIDRSAATHMQRETDRVLEAYTKNPDKAIKPIDFDAFSKEMQRNFEGVKPGQLYEAYSKALYNRLFNSSGRTLEALQKSLGVKVKGTIPDPAARKQTLLEIEGVTPEARAQMRAEAKGASSRQKFRIGAIRLISEKLLKEAQPERSSITNVSPEDIRYSGESKEPAFFDISRDDLAHPELLGQRLAADSRRSNSDPVSLTKRVTALLDKQTGKVYLVSTYPHGRSGAMLVDPSLSQVRNHKPLSELLARYRPVSSILLDEPVRGFRQSFDSLGDYEVKLATDARRAVQSVIEPPLAEGEAPSPGSWEHVEPITDAEAAGILDHITTEVGKFDSPEDIKASLEALREKPNYQVISGYRKLAAEVYRKNPDLSDIGVINQLAQNIYENHIKAGTPEAGETPFEAFRRRTLSQGGAGYRPDVGTGPATAEPASIRRNVQDVADSVKAGADAIRYALAGHPTEDLIARKFDDSHNLPANAAREVESGIRLQSGKKLGDKKVLAAAKPIVQSGAIINGRVDQPLLSLKLNQFQDQVRVARRDSLNMLRSQSFLERRKGAIKLRATKAAKAELDYAQSHSNDPDLINTALRAHEAGDQIYNQLRNAGVEVNYAPNYLPGRYDISGTDGRMWFFKEPKLIGTKWREPATFDNYYQALAVPGKVYVPATSDVASLMGHATRRGLELIQKKQFNDFVKAQQTPDGRPVAVDAKHSAQSGQMTPPQGFAGYEVVGGLAVHPDYAPLLRNLTQRSIIEDMPVTRAILHFEQMLKHNLLLGDLFHLGRVVYYGASLMREKAGFKGGWTALDFAERDLPDAVRKGIITQRQADWGRERVPFGQRTVTRRTPTGTAQSTSPNLITRRELLQLSQRAAVGFNIGKIQDALYKDVFTQLTPTSGPLKTAVARILDPTTGRYNRFLFDKLTRGLMAESFVAEYERQAKALPNADPLTLMRDISRDINNYFGNIGRQGWFKSKSSQDLARMLFLAPQWVEGLVKKEAVGASRLTVLSKLTGQRQGKALLGATGKGIGSGLLFMLGLTQAINIISRGKPTWQNEENDHKWDAYIPALGGRDEGVWLNPLSLFAEISHDLWRLNRTKPTFMDALDQIAGNKESPLLRAAIIARFGHDDYGRRYTTTGSRLKAIGKSLTPVPISFGRQAQYLGAKLAPNLIPPVTAQQMTRQMLSTVGIKTEPSETAYIQTKRLAEKFMQEKGYKRDTGWTEVPTDEASYTQLRSQLRTGDLKGAQRTYQQLLRGRDPGKLIKAMRKWANAPLTGSKTHENEFIMGLSDPELKAYGKMEQDRLKSLQQFYDLVLSQP